jgi:hypothetical protein
LRVLTFILGAVLAAYSGAGILSGTIWQTSETVDRALCRALLCTNATLLERGRQQLDGAGIDNAAKAVDTFEIALRRDPQNAYRWSDLGKAYLDSGQRDRAEYCYQRVLALAPHFPALLLRAANFYFQIGNPQAALPITARILALTPGYDAIVFSEYARLADRVDNVLQFGIPDTDRAARSWLRFLMQSGRLQDEQRSWQWVSERRHVDEVLAGEYVAFLIRQGHPEWAASAWAEYLGKHAGDYGKPNYLFNGDFLSEPVSSPFDWNLARTLGVEVDRDFTQPGRCALRIAFAGTQNLGVPLASQLAYVKPGPYRFQAMIRTEGVTTDEGLRFRIADAEVPSRLDLVFGNFTDTHPWTPVQHDLVVPRATRLLEVQVIRRPSLKFDNKVGGTVWVDALSLESATTPHL